MLPHPFIPSAWTSWAKKEYDTLTPLTASQTPVTFRLERIYVELHSTWQSPAELEAQQKRGTQKRKKGRRSKETLDHELEGSAEPSRRPLSTLVGMPDVRCLALKGGPGSGKSTFLRSLLLQRLNDPAPEPVLPLYLELKELGVWLKQHPSGGTAPEQLLTWAGESLTKWGLSAEALARRSGHGRVIWLLDGLDEIFEDELRHRAAQIIGGYFKHLPGAADRLVLAGRPHAFEDARLVCHLGVERHTAELDALTDEERAEFLEKWFAEVYLHNLARAQEQAEALTNAIPQHEKVDELSRTPLLLSTMAAVYQMGRVLPERRADLYDKAVEVMLHRRFGGELKPGGFTQRQVRRALTVVAKEMMEAGEVRSLTRLDFERVIEASYYPNGASETERVELESLNQWLGAQSGLLALRGEPLRVTFSHLGFQEFLCAEWYANQREPLTTLGKHLDEPAWREVVLLLGGRLLMDGLGQLGEQYLNGLFEVGGEGVQAAWRTALLASVVMEAPEGALPVGFEERLRPRLLEVMGGKTFSSTFRERVRVGLCLGKVGDPRLGLEKAENWIWIPPGEFMMGSNDYEDETPIHQVKLTQGFYLSRFPVTNHDFKAFVDAGGYQTQAWWSEEGWAFCQKQKLEAPRFWIDAQWNGPNQPVVGVSWYEAEAFCHWMTMRWSSKEAGRVVRLPSEAEWEYAARGKEGRAYPWGKEKPTAERANYNQTGISQTSP
ncbi:MAG: SUMF1/EgtB/PvdO family nonheme iron enzyme, partial [Myxococcota bacterium]